MTVSVQWLCMAQSLKLPVKHKPATGTMYAQTTVSAQPFVTLQFALTSMLTHMRKSAAQKLQRIANKEVKEEEQRHCKQARLCHHTAHC